ncbi:12967_t:CDS:1 [Ambispora leptoticha]|uniref:12967_t:CDS:1 n=1 Tax=Ambispora leptoticha TaxID=144679 RepID=A0A9N9D4W5_9GLOM|nr:12967_t:CDS:1 [Ambispora leptoticha]
MSTNKSNNIFTINDDQTPSSQKLHQLHRRRMDRNENTIITHESGILKIGFAIVLFLLLSLIVGYAIIVTKRKNKNLIPSPNHKKRISISLWQKNLVFIHSRSIGSSLLEYNQQQQTIQINQGKERRGLRLDKLGATREGGGVTVLSPIKEEAEELSESLPKSATTKEIEEMAAGDDESYVMVSNV